MSYKLFIAGTNTGVGKTYASVNLLNAFKRLGFSTLALKPVASGCSFHQGKLYSDDALALQQAASIKLNYDAINPYAFQPAIAPHLAADLTNTTLDLKQLQLKLHDGLIEAVDICLIEGAGGWYTPLNDEETMADFAVQNKMNVLLIIRIELGCLNHSMLTIKAMQHDGAKVIGWIANCMQPEIAYCDEQINSLKKLLPSPYLGKIKYNDELCQDINIQHIFSC